MHQSDDEISCHVIARQSSSHPSPSTSLSSLLPNLPRVQPVTTLQLSAVTAAAALLHFREQSSNLGPCPLFNGAATHKSSSPLQPASSSSHSFAHRSHVASVRTSCHSHCQCQCQCQSPHNLIGLLHSITCSTYRARRRLYITLTIM